MDGDETPIRTRNRSWRAMRGTLILAALGAAIGFVIGTTLLTGLLIPGGGPFTSSNAFLALVYGGGVGAVLGAIGAPLMGWLVLRPVPLGRAIGWTALGTVLGTIAFMFLVNDNPVYGGLLGFVAGGIGARLWTRRLARATSADAVPAR